MKYINLFAFNICFVLITSCGGGAETPETSTTIYVDPSVLTESESDGSEAHPFKKIKTAIAHTPDGWTVLLSSGFYTPETGQDFPIVIDKNVTIQGTSGAIIDGGGHYYSSKDIPVAIVATKGTIKSLTITSVGGIGIIVPNGGDIKIEYSKITNSNYGVTAHSNSKLTLIGNEIQNNTLTGIEVTNPFLFYSRANTITNNSTGLAIYNASTTSIDIGSLDYGISTHIGLNKDCDLFYSGDNVINAYGTVWDSDQLSFTIAKSCTSGSNISVQGMGTVNYQYKPNEYQAIFPRTGLIKITQPQYDSIVYTRVPNVSWNRTGRKNSVIAIFSSPPVIRGGKIVNSNNIVWIWHSGLSGSDGFVDFMQGSGSSDLSTYQIPNQLSPGRSYYIAAWSWDDDNLLLTESSNASIFYVHPNAN